MTVNNSDMFNVLHDRILIINRAGKVVYANASARADFSGELSALLNLPMLRDAINRITVQGLPDVIELKLSPDPSQPDKITQVSVVLAPNGQDAVMVAHPTDNDTRDTRVSALTVAELFKQHLLKDLREFSSAATELVTNEAASPVQPRELAKKLALQVEKVLDMIAVFGQDALVGEERILPSELMHEICHELAPSANQAGMKISQKGFETKLPPVYGSRKWIKRAFREILENAIVYGSEQKNAVKPGLIEIEAHQNGAFLMLHFRNWGTAAAPVWQQGTNMIFGGNSAQKTVNGKGLRIGLPLAQRIVELHGGTLRIRSDNDGLTEVTLQVPTGAPFRNHQQLDMAQAQRYAEDLARLMAGRRRKNTTSPASAG